MTSQPNPRISSGANWTAAEDEKLRRLMLELVRQFPERSVAAVLSRVESSRSLDAWRWPEGDGDEEIPL